MFIPEVDEIYFAKTKEYFREVLSSYSNKNYRSAIVMLYSVAICDMLLKLEELKDMYNDTVAISLLGIANQQKDPTMKGSKSSWEKDFLDQVYKQTSLLDLEAYTHLNHLYDDRNFSAHPAINDSYQLISPSQETTIAHIKNILNDILIKPPIFIKDVIDMLTDDMAEKREVYTDEAEQLQIYLNNKYYSKMSSNMKIKVYRALWKLCFMLSDDSECKKNRTINRKALSVLTEKIETDIISVITQDSNKFNVATDDNCIWQLIFYLSLYPALYKVLNQDVIVHIDDMLRRTDELKTICWFKSHNMKEHLIYLASLSDLELNKGPISYMIRHYTTNGYLSDLVDFFINRLSASYSYNNADTLFEQEITPVLEKMTKSQFISLITAINGNNQIYGRNASYSTNNIVVKTGISKLGYDFDFAPYPNFKFNHNLLTLPEDTVKPDTTDSEDMSF